MTGQFVKDSGVSGITHGMDVGGVQSLASAMNMRAERLGELAASLSALVESTAWTGDDADRFRRDWRDIHAGQLLRVSQALRDAAEGANRNARAQWEASGR